MNKASWADRVEYEDNDLVVPNEVIDGDLKIITDYREIEGKKCQVTRTYKVEKKQVPRAIAYRKSLPKYGDSKNDPAGPNPATTMVDQEVLMQLVSIKGGVEEPQETEEELQMQVKQQLSKTVSCRICKEEHWTTQCPYKDRVSSSAQLDESSRAAAAAANAASKGLDPSKSSRYVIPSMRDGANRRGESMAYSKQQPRDENTVRVTNLSEDIRERDLQELFGAFGPLERVYLAKDKITNQSKGFAFISYKFKEHALQAINHLHGYGYDNLILSVEMAKPNN